MCILLVEDEFMIRELAELVLEDAGHEVLAAEHGQGAYDHIDRYPGRFSCLLTDYYMPGGITGADVILRMRSLYPDVPVILTSATPYVVTAAWRDEHAVELLAKPFFPDELVRMISRLTQRPSQ